MTTTMFYHKFYHLLVFIPLHLIFLNIIQILTRNPGRHASSNLLSTCINQRPTWDLDGFPRFVPGIRMTEFTHDLF